MASIKFTNAVANEYNKLWATAAVKPNWKAMAGWAVDQIVRNRPRYEYVSKLTGVPWYVIGVIHCREAIPPFSFKCHLHNGEPLTDRTRFLEPKGRPAAGNPPFTWEVSAVDALKLKNLHNRKDWSISGILWVLEGYNGYGYKMKNKTNPYLWSGTQHYLKGKYTSDKKYNENAIDKQIGTATILKEFFAVTGIPAPGVSSGSGMPGNIFEGLKHFFLGV